MNDFNYSPPTGLRDVTAYPSEPVSEAAAREQFQGLLDQLKSFLNTDIKTELNKFTPENVINPTKLNAWVDYDTAIYGQLRYWKDSFGNVYVKGTLKAGSGSVPIFILPTGYRPLKTEIFPSWCNGEVLGHVNVLADGSVVPYAGNNTLLVINIIFRAGA